MPKMSRWEAKIRSAIQAARETAEDMDRVAADQRDRADWLEGLIKEVESEAAQTEDNGVDPDAGIEFIENNGVKRNA